MKLINLIVNLMHLNALLYGNVHKVLRFCRSEIFNGSLTNHEYNRLSFQHPNNGKKQNKKK